MVYCCFRNDKLLCIANTYIRNKYVNNIKIIFTHCSLTNITEPVELNGIVDIIELYFNSN